MKTYRIQGLYRGEWKNLFSFENAKAAKEALAELEERNPACRYRFVRIVGDVTYV